MPRRKNCNIVKFRAVDPAWNAERRNDKLVFKAIERRRRNGLSISKSIRALFASVEWRGRMSGKTSASWKRKYLRWRFLVTIGKRKKMRLTPENIGSGEGAKSFIGTPGDDMPRTPAMSAGHERKA